MKKIFGNRYIRAIGVVVLSILFTLIGSLIGSLIALPLTHSENTALQFASLYFSFIGIWIVVIVFCLIRKKDRKLLSKLGRGGKGNNWKVILAVGLPCGIGINLLIAVIAMLHGDITLSFSEFNPAIILLFIVCVAIQSGAEELIDRFYLYQKFNELFPKFPVVPIIVSAVVFSAMHMANNGVTVLALVNIVLVGILYALIIYYFDCIWAAVLAHTGWNFCQNILLGLPNSGTASAYSVFKLDQSTAMNSFAYDVNFGVEGTILASVLLAVTCVVIILIGRKRKAKAEMKNAQTI